MPDFIRPRDEIYGKSGKGKKESSAAANMSV